MFNAPPRRSSKRRLAVAVTLMALPLASYAVASAGAADPAASQLVEVSESSTDVMTRPAGASTVADPPGTQTVQPGELSVKAKTITKGGATIVATAVFAVVTAGVPVPPTTAPPTTAPPTTAPPVTQSTLAGWPDASNTGVPAGKALTPSGGFTVTQAGTVVDGLDINGCLVIRANNVTVQNTRVRQNGLCWGGAIDVGYDNSGIVVRDVEIDGKQQNSRAQLIGNSGYTCIRCNLHDGGQGFHMNNNVTIVDSYVHNLYNSDTAHNDGALSNGGAHMVLRHNNITCELQNSPLPGGGCTGALVLLGDFAPIQDVLAENNLFNGGAFALYAGSLPEKPYAHADNVRFVGNKFGRRLFANSGMFGPVTGFETSGAGNQFSGNTWAETGLPASLIDCSSAARESQVTPATARRRSSAVPKPRSASV